MEHLYEKDEICTWRFKTDEAYLAFCLGKIQQAKTEQNKWEALIPGLRESVLGDDKTYRGQYVSLTRTDDVYGVDTKRVIEEYGFMNFVNWAKKELQLTQGQTEKFIAYCQKKAQEKLDKGKLKEGESIVTEDVKVLSKRFLDLSAPVKMGCVKAKLLAPADFEVIIKGKEE